MVFDFKLPDVGEGISEGLIVKWLVKEGDSVKEDQAIVQVETDKAVVDLPSPKTGTIISIKYKEGEKAKVGQTLVSIGDKGEKAPKVKEEKLSKNKEDKTKEEIPVKKGQSVVGQLEEAPDEILPVVQTKPLASAMRGPTQSVKILAAPAVRALAAHQGIDLSDIKGSGEEGRILIKDINKESLPLVKQENVKVTSDLDDHGRIQKIPLSGIRKTIATNMMRSLNTSAQLSMMEDVNVSVLWSLRNKYKDNLEKKGIKLTLLPFITKAIIAALKEHPMLNATIENEEIILKKYYNIGIAAETEVGLMVPVIKNAEHKSIIDLAKEITLLSEKARTRTIEIADLKDGTFTITNYGSVGGKYATPILNPGESAILGIGRMFDHLSLNKKGKVTQAKILPLSLSFDHRIVDGGQASRFLETLKIYLEDPSHLLLELD